MCIEEHPTSPTNQHECLSKEVKPRTKAEALSGRGDGEAPVPAIEQDTWLEWRRLRSFGEVERGSHLVTRVQ